MKYIIYIFLLFLGMDSTAQSKKERIAMSNAELLEKTVFGTKDSATLERLFAKTLHYEHSNGKVESREEALQGISHNKSVYVQQAAGTLPTAVRVAVEGDSVVVNKAFKATENKADGSAVQLDFMVTTVWINEAGSWKLARRKATKQTHKQ